MPQYNEWDELARKMGYADEKDMLTIFYLEYEWSVSTIARKLGAGQATIARRLSLCGIDKNPRGGANNSAKQRQRLHYFDQRAVFIQTPREVAKALNISESTVYKYKRLLEGGIQRGVLHNQSGRGVEPVFNTNQKSLSAAASQEPPVS